MSQHEIYWLETDEEMEEHLARHGVTLADIWEMLWNDHVTTPNRQEPDRILLIGRNNAGRLFTVSLEQTGELGTWRPVTGWHATPAESRLFERHRS